MTELLRLFVFDRLVSSGTIVSLVYQGHEIELMLREKKKIVMKEGDSEEFYVEKYIGYVGFIL